MRVLAETKYGTSFVWGDPEPFRSIGDVIREMSDPGSVTNHPRSYFPTAGDWLDSYDVRDDGRATVAFLYRPCDCGNGPSPHPHDDAFAIVTVGPRGGMRVEYL